MNPVEPSDVIGFIYPVPSGISAFMLNGKRNLFLKYPALRLPLKTKLILEPGAKLFFYESGGSKAIIGDARIVHIKLAAFSKLSQEERKKTMIPSDVLKKYCAGRENKLALIFKLDKIRKYPRPIRILVPMSMAGRYVLHSNLSAVLEISPSQLMQ